MSTDIKKGHWFKVENQQSISACNLTANKPYKCLKVVIGGVNDKVFFIDDNGKEDWHHMQHLIKCEGPEMVTTFKIGDRVKVTARNQHFRSAGQWGKKHGIECAENPYVKNGMEGKILAIHLRDDDCKSDEVALAVLLDGTILPIKILHEGVSLIEDVKHECSMEYVPKFRRGDKVVRIKGPVRQAAKLLTTYTVDCVSDIDGRLRLDEVGGAYSLENWTLESDLAEKEPEIVVHGDCLLEGKIDFKDIAPKNLKENAQWQHYNAQTETYSTQPEEETIMKRTTNDIMITVPTTAYAETKTVTMYGAKIDVKDEDALLGVIAQIEHDQEKLKAINKTAKSSRITGQISKLGHARTKIVALLDELPEEGEDE